MTSAHTEQALPAADVAFPAFPIPSAAIRAAQGALWDASWLCILALSLLYHVQTAWPQPSPSPGHLSDQLQKKFT